MQKLQVARGVSSEFSAAAQKFMSATVCARLCVCLDLLGYSKSYWRHFFIQRALWRFALKIRHKPKVIFKKKQKKSAAL